MITALAALMAAAFAKARAFIVFLSQMSTGQSGGP
jgi:hypothetical protein